MWLLRWATADAIKMLLEISIVDYWLEFVSRKWCTLKLWTFQQNGRMTQQLQVISYTLPRIRPGFFLSNAGLSVHVFVQNNT